MCMSIEEIEKRLEVLSPGFDVGTLSNVEREEFFELLELGKRLLGRNRSRL